ncbi:MAG: LamG domain-containing protein, partial [Pseudomonadota bacterium]
EPGTDKVILELDGDYTFDGTNAKVKNYEHTNVFSTASAEISFSFIADDVQDKAGLFSKDANGMTGDGNHLSVYLENGSLIVRFQNGETTERYELDGVKANQEYDVEVSFGNGRIEAIVDGEVIGFNNNYDFTWSESSEYTQVGAFGGQSTTGTSSFTNKFEGQISDLSVRTPGDDVDPDRMEVGTLTVRQNNADQWHKVTFDEAIQNAVVIMGPIYDEYHQPAVPRVRNVTSEGFEFQIDEWDYLDGGQIPVEISWIAGSEGVHEIDGTTIQFGSTVADGKRQQQVSLEDADFGDAPIVLTQVASDNDEKAVVSRAGGVFNDSFEFRLQNEQAKASEAHADEDVHWVAISADGNGNVFETGFQQVASTEVRVNGATADEAFFAGMQTFDGNDTAGLRYNETHNGGVRLWIEEEQSLDDEVWHMREKIGWVNIEDGVYDFA